MKYQVIQHFRLNQGNSNEELLNFKIVQILEAQCNPRNRRKQTKVALKGGSLT